jgi:hypothetical protein
MLQDDTSISNKKARSVRLPRLTDIAAHVRLHIYGFLNQNDTKIIYEDKDGYDVRNVPQWQSLTYPRIPVKPYEIEIAFACVVGDLEVLQYVHGFSDTLAVPDKLESDPDDYYNTRSHLGLFYRMSALLICHRNWKTLRWARQMKFPWDEWSFNIAILTGVDERILKWLRRRGCPWSPLDLCVTFEYAVGCCSLDFIKWLRLEGCPWTGYCFARAIKRGDWEIITWLRCNGCPPADEFDAHHACSEALKYAVIKNDPLYVQYLLREFERNTLYDTDFVSIAFRRSDIPVLQVIVDAGYAPRKHEYFVEAIIRYRLNLDRLQFLRKAGCQLHANVFVAAVERGDLDILRWLRQEGCPWDASVFTKALEKGNLDIIQWLFEEKCPTNEDSIKIMMEKNVLVPR